MTLPRNIEAEAALIGSLMIDNRSIDRIADKLSPEDFYEPLHGRLFAGIVREASLGKQANPVTLKPYFDNDNAFQEIGGVGYLAKLTENNAALIGTDSFADQIAVMAKRRRLIERLNEAAEVARNLELSNDEVIDAADSAISAATDGHETIPQLSGAQCFDELIASFDEPQTGVECKVIKPIDDLLGSMRPKQLIIGAGRPGMGKTAVALSYSIGAAMNGHGVLFISLEMSSVELAARMAADMCFDGEGGIPYEVIRDRKLNRRQTMEVCRAREMMAEMPFRVVDAGKLTIGRLNMLVRRHTRRFAAQGHKLELVVVDYLQLVSPDQRRNSNYEAVSEVSRGLKAIAKDHGVAVFALAQLSREVEKRPDKRPQLADLRDSGQIEQDADAVLFLTRDEYYISQNEPEDKDSAEYLEWQSLLEKARGRIDFICAKRRNGRTGVAQGAFHGAYQAVRGGWGNK